ncbi:hypothetical protein OsJ_17129 [Oryza sativa Japonica Group]|uniref:Fe2OG dioxygenase domain-containing protein n=1 Tax=Oryza sativa subsp. japonica TaxID=39947 RepID=B9FMG6_ORYSJ|nr:hypothetical protein OsJ_17129 [Oryza sativa Japonica Group]
MVVPVINFSKLDGTAAERAETMAQIDNGCEEWGFFQLVNHGVPKELLDRVKKWPSKPPEFKETMREYRAALRGLAERVMEAMDENLGLDKGRMRRAFTGDGRHAPFFGTKVSHYPPCPRPDLITGLRAHTDAGGVILLFQDDRVGGLQVLRGGEWVDVQPLADAIVVNTGNQVEVLSNGR